MNVGDYMIFQFSDYRSYFKHYLKLLPKQGFGEAKKIADHLGVSSTYISQILAGTKILTLEQTNALGSYLGLSEIEADYFFYLVQNERAGTQELKKYCRHKLDELKKKSLKLVARLEPKRSLNEQEKSVFYSSPLFSGVHVYCSTGKKGRTLDEIANRFELSRAKVTEIMRFLVESGLCNESNQHFFTGSQGTHLEQGSPHLLKHHTNWRLRAIQSAESLADDELMYTVNVSLSEKDFHFLREEMVDFIKKFLDRVHPSTSEEIACLNLDWFRIRK